MLRARSLHGIRVLDMTQVLAGPFCTLQLADLGAEVIKVEGPHGASREMGFGMQGSDSAGFLALNRNKKSLSLDLKTEDGRDALLRLVATADVFVENYRPGVTARLGIDFPSLSEINSRLVYASISGFGQTGPLAPRPGYDLLAQALSGVMSVTGHPGVPPVKCGLPIGDLTAGLFGAQGVLAALLEREQTGRGQHIDTSLLDSLLALSVWESSELWATGGVPEPLGSAHRASAPYQAVQAADGYIPWPSTARPSGIGSVERSTVPNWPRTSDSRPTQHG
jgi:crotonobetainyl-CoA:carnitine CoA-transferase CaiB-like acyl-CoA transferase